MLRSTILLSVMAILVGCTGGIRDTTTARTATEVLLVSTAAERAIKQYEVSGVLKGKKVSIDDARYDSIDKPYVVSALRNHLAAAGVILSSEEPDYILEMRNGTLGIYDNDFTFGVPGLPIILGNVGAALPPLVTPPLNIFRRDTSQGWCKMQLWVYDAKTNEHVSTSKELWGSSYYNQWVILFIGPIDGFNDIYPD